MCATTYTPTPRGSTQKVIGYEKADSLHNLMFSFLLRTLTRQVMTISRIPNSLQFKKEFVAS
jgi:hypothetical protein